MKLTLETDYAFRIVSHLAVHDGEVVPAPSIAAAEAIPERFILRIMRKLNKAGITAAQRGAQGGYYLTRPAKNIALYDVILAVYGPIEINRCLNGEEAYCSKNSKAAMAGCPFHNALGQIQSNIIRMFAETSVNDIICSV